MSYIEENTKSRERLQAVVSRLSEEELSLPVRWLTAAFLVHLAFWDFRVLALMQRWKNEPVAASPIDVDIVNDATKPLCLAIPPREAVKIVLSAAEAVDAELEQFPEDLLPGITALVQEGKFRLDRSLQRNEHMDQIEKILAEFRSL
jgi:hypothetical protein